MTTATDADTRRRPYPPHAEGRGAVVLDRISKRYGDQLAVDDLSLTIEPGEFISLLGPSGCGKTTTLRMIAGFEEPDAGDILVSGQSVLGTPPYRRDVNTVFQAYALFPHMSVAENVAYGLQQRRTPKAEIRERVSAALDMVQMRRFADRKPTQLSGGQQQRVALVARPGQPPRRAAARRAARRARPPAARRDAARAQAPPVAARHHVRVRDPRPGRGAVDERPHRRHARRPHRAARRFRHDLRRAGIRLRRRVRRPAELLRRPRDAGVRSRRIAARAGSRPAPSGPCCTGRPRHAPRFARSSSSCPPPVPRVDVNARGGRVIGVSHLGETMQFLVQLGEDQTRSSRAGPRRMRRRSTSATTSSCTWAAADVRPGLRLPTTPRPRAASSSPDRRGPSDPSPTPPDTPDPTREDSMSRAAPCPHPGESTAAPHPRELSRRRFLSFAAAAGGAAFLAACSSRGGGVPERSDRRHARGPALDLLVGRLRRPRGARRTSPRSSARSSPSTRSARTRR